jgi:peptide/nickel transport system permease protein
LSAWRRFLRHPVAVLSLSMLVLLGAAALAAPLVESWLGIDVNAVSLLNRFGPPSAENWLGTDELGRDVLVRLLYGGRVSLFVGIVAALSSAVIGTVIGLIAGFYGGRLDDFLMRFTDGVIALPLLPLLIVLAAVDLGKLGVPAGLAQSDQVSLYRIIVIVSLGGWTTVARLVRGAALSVRQREFVLAATALGAGNLRLMLVHILPNVASPIVVATTLSIAKLGQHADQRAGTDLVGADAGNISGPSDLRHGDRLQLRRRRLAGRAGPKGGATASLIDLPGQMVSAAGQSQDGVAGVFIRLAKAEGAPGIAFDKYVSDAGLLHAAKQGRIAA